MENEEFNGTEVAKQILACVYKINQRFGINYIARVLIGSNSQKIGKFGHEKIASFGGLKDYSFEQVRLYINELIEQGYLVKSSGLYPVVQLTDKSYEVKAGRETVILPAPEAKLARKSTMDWSETVSRTLELYKMGRTVAQIAQERNLAQRTIFNHLASAYQNGEAIDIDSFVPAERQIEIAQAFEKLGTDYLSPVRKELGGGFSWEDLQLVRAKLLRSQPPA